MPIYRGMPSVSDTEATYDLLLTPQFYTFQKKQMNLRFTHQAMRIAPSVLGELVEEDGNYCYFVYKDETGWNFFAYNPTEILDFVKAKGIPQRQIGKLYFAQQMVDGLHTPISLGEKEALGTIDKTVVFASKGFFENRTFTTLEELEKPTRGVYPKEGSEGGVLFGKKEAMIYSVVLALFSLFWIVQGVRYEKRLEPIDKRIRSVLTEMPELKSGYKRESIYQKYKKIDTTQRRLRSWFVRLSKAVFGGVSLKALAYKKEHVSVSFVCKDVATATRFVKALEGAEGMKVIRKNDKEVTVEGAI